MAKGWVLVTITGLEEIAQEKVTGWRRRARKRCRICGLLTNNTLGKADSKEKTSQPT